MTTFHIPKLTPGLTFAAAGAAACSVYATRRFFYRPAFRRDANDLLVTITIGDKDEGLHDLQIWIAFRLIPINSDGCLNLIATLNRSASREGGPIYDETACFASITWDLFYCPWAVTCASFEVAMHIANIETIAGLPINAWEIVFVHLEIPDLINLGESIPNLTRILNRAKDWGRIYAEEFKSNSTADFTFFARNWRKLYMMDTKGRVPEMNRTKLNHPIQTLTECLLQSTDGELFTASDLKDTKTKCGPIRGASGTCWSGHQLWVRDKYYTMHSVTVGFDFECAAQINDFIYLYSPELGIVQADIPNSRRPSTIRADQVQRVIMPKGKVKQLCPTSSGLIYLTESGSIYDTSGIACKGEFTKLVRVDEGFVALNRRGSLWNSNYGTFSTYNEPMKDICISLNILLVVGNSGHLYVLDKREGMSIRDTIPVPGQVICISASFFTRHICAIVSQNDANIGKRSLKTKFKSGFQAVKRDIPYTIGAGFFL